MMDNTKKHLRISGRVQGVGFRHFTRQNARELNITGWVRNLPNGDVETVLQGDQKSVQAMIDRLESGPRMARVDQVEEISGSDELNKQYSDFSVRS